MGYEGQALLKAAGEESGQTEGLVEAFLEPPDGAWPWVYWFVCDGNLTREGITADFEAMKRVGIHGVLYMEVDQYVPKGPARFLTPQWREMITQAVNEATWLGITRGISAPAEEKIIRQPSGFVYQQEWWTTWLVDRPFHDVDGLLKYITRNIEEIHNRQFGDMFTFAGKSNVWRASSKSPREQYLELQEKVGENTVIFPNESPVGLDTVHVRAGLDLLAYAYAENPQLVSDWLEALNWAEIQRVRETADPTLWPVALVYADIAGTSELMFSPKFLRKEFFPRLAKLVATWHEHGIKVIYHSDGNLWAVLDDFRRAGIDGINPLESLSTMYAGDVHRAYPQWLLMGGIDVSQLLPFGSEADVRGTVRKTLAEAGNTGKLWIGSTTEIHPDAKLENVLAMWDEIEKHASYDQRVKN